MWKAHSYRGIYLIGSTGVFTRLGWEGGDGRWSASPVMQTAMQLRLCGAQRVETILFSLTLGIWITLIIKRHVNISRGSFRTVGE